MIQIRKENPELVYADFEDLDPNHDHVFCYLRKGEGKEYLTILNLSDEFIKYKVKFELNQFKMLINNYKGYEIIDKSIHLAPWQSVLCTR